MRPALARPDPERIVKWVISSYCSREERDNQFICRGETKAMESQTVMQSNLHLTRTSDHLPTALLVIFEHSAVVRIGQVTRAKCSAEYRKGGKEEKTNAADNAQE